MRGSACALCAVSLVPLLAGCGETSPSQSTSAKDWVLHKNPAGFVVRHPRGWAVSATPQGFVLVRDSAKKALVLVYPFLSPQSMTSDQWLRRLPGVSGLPLSDVRVEKTRQARKQPDETVAWLECKLGETPARSIALCSIDGRSGMLYAVAAHRDEFGKLRQTLVAVLKSFSFTGASSTTAQKPADAEIKYVRWIDPKENAFSLEVPSGWKVSGGLFRFAAVDVRSCVTLQSPDGEIRITGGDSDIPTFSIPFSPLFPEGSWYSPGYGVQMKVRRYVTGVDFAKEYVRTKVAVGYSDLTFTESRDRPDVSRAINAITAQYEAYGITQRLSTGEVAFTCQSNGKKLSGYYFAGTTLVAYQTGLGAGGIWYVQYLYGYIAPADKVRLAQAVLDHGIRTVQVNPQWAAMQQGIAAETSKIVSQTHAEISKVIDQSYWSRQRTMEDISRKWSNAILGQTDVVDPETGETWKVASGHNYYWRKEHTDVIAGTSTYDRPDIDFTPLLEW